MEYWNRKASVFAADLALSAATGLLVRLLAGTPHCSQWAAKLIVVLENPGFINEEIPVFREQSRVDHVHNSLHGQSVDVWMSRIQQGIDSMTEENSSATL